MPRPPVRHALAALALTLVATAIGSGTATAAGPSPAAVTVADAATRCDALVGLEVDASAFSHPTRGAVVERTELLAPDGAQPELCQVNGHVRPFDEEAPSINFQVNLPTSWNGDAVQFGGGGFNGTLVTGLGALPGSSDVTTAAPTPIERGYATFGSDGGTAVGKEPLGSFALNEESLANYSGESVKRTLDGARAVIEEFYGQAPRHQFHVGGSKGGHEGLVAAQRYGEHYDGVVAYYPANQNQAMSLSWYHLQQQAYARPGGYLGPAEQQLVEDSVLTACDGLDGVEDGLIADLAGCDTTFDVADLVCPDGSDAGDHCLSTTQAETLRAADEPYTFAFPLAHGVTDIGPFPVFHGAPLSGIWLDDAGDVASTGYATFTGAVLRYFIQQDPGGSTVDFDYRDHADRVAELSASYDATDPDLDTFVEGGGKLILVQGSTDMLVPQSTTSAYYQRVAARYGDSTGEAVRYFTQPGYGHGNGAFELDWDSMTALEAWVEDGTAPTDQVARDGNAATRDRSLPLCEFPAWPQYRGTGETTVSTSYTCASSDAPEPPADVASISITASATEVPRGGSITLSATGFDSDGEQLGDVTGDVTFSSDVASDQVDGATVTFPTASPHTLTGRHAGGAVATITVTVVDDAGAGPGGTGAGADGASGTDGALPDTGGPSLAALALAVVAALVGWALVRRRSGRRAAPTC